FMVASTASNYGSPKLHIETIANLVKMLSWHTGRIYRPTFPTRRSSDLVYLFDNGLAPYFSYAESFQPQVSDPSTSLGGVPFKPTDRKSTRLNSSHVKNSYAVSCLKKKKICRSINP